MKKFCLVCLLLLALSGRSMAQKTFPSLETCIRYAFQHRPDLQNDRILETQAKNQKKLASSFLYPQIKAVSTYDDYLSLPVQLIPAELVGGPAGVFRRIRFGTQYSFTYGLEATVPLISTQNWFNVKVAETQIRVARYQKYSDFQAAAEQIARTYYVVLLTREATAIALENKEVNDTILLVSDQKYKHGILEPLDYNRLKALQLESTQTWLDNQTAYQRNLLQLKTYLGISASEPLELTETLSNIQQNAISLTATAEESNQSRTLQWKSRVAEQEWRMQKARWAPELSAYSRYTRQSLSNKYNVLNPTFPWFEVSLIGLRLDWPIFTGFNRSVSIRQASLSRQVAENNLMYQNLTTQQQYAELTVNFQNAQSSLKTYQESYALYEDNYGLAVYKYQQNVYSTDQLLQVYAEKLRSQRLYIDAMGNYYISRALIQLKNEFSNLDKDMPYDQN